jgi:glycosyltransferase involved in cell wall biosynthesis
MSERVALVHDWLNGMRGGERVLEELLHICPQADIFTLFLERGKLSPLIAGQRITASRLNRWKWARRHYPWLLPLLPAVVESFDLRDYPLVISSSHCVAKGVVSAPDALHVSYIHSPMRYAWDQYYAYFASARGWKRRIIESQISRLRQWDVTSAARVDHFVANSHYVRQRIEKYYRRSARVIHPPVDTDFFTPGESPSRDYFLLVSALVPYKRIETAIDACAGTRHQLVIAGSGPEASRLRRRVSANIRFAGQAGIEELRRLYRNAAALVFAGVEDFGIAFAEALSCGTPVIAYGRGGVTDIVTSGLHGLLYEDDSAAGLRRSLDAFDPGRFSASTLRERGLEFSRSRFRDQFGRLLAELRP